MADAPYCHFPQQSQHRLHIDFRRLKQRFAQALPPKLRHRRVQVRVFDVENLPHQAEAVGMNAGARQRNHDIPDLHGPVINHLRLVHNPRGISRQIVFVFRHHPGMLCCFPADQGASGLNAAFANALDNLLNHFRHVFSAGNVVQEE